MNSRLRGVLATFQFLVTIVLTISTIVAGRRMQYIQPLIMFYARDHYSRLSIRISP